MPVPVNDPAVSGREWTSLIIAMPSNHVSISTRPDRIHDSVRLRPEE
jgi:hypothetical protein